MSSAGFVTGTKANGSVEIEKVVHTNTLTENLADIQERDRYDVVLAGPNPLLADQGISNAARSLEAFTCVKRSIAHDPDPCYAIDVIGQCVRSLHNRRQRC
jgi:hypothetical protein